MIDEAYIWRWAEVQGETGEWMLGSMQHTEKEQQRVKETEQTLRIACGSMGEYSVGKNITQRYSASAKIFCTRGTKQKN